MTIHPNSTTFDSTDYNMSGELSASTTTGGSIVATYCDIPPATPSSTYYLTNDWVVMYEGYKIQIYAQGDDSFLLDKGFMQYCRPGDWDGSACTTYTSLPNGGSNQVAWCISTDHSAAEVLEQNNHAHNSLCCDGVDTVLSGVGSSPSFLYMEYYDCGSVSPTISPSTSPSKSPTSSPSKSPSKSPTEHS